MDNGCGNTRCSVEPASSRRGAEADKFDQLQRRTTCIASTQPKPDGALLVAASAYLPEDDALLLGAAIQKVIGARE